ncbi:hypothetical protein GII33_01065 [Gordonia pseudamarae]|jgi:hypothetical protein|uniref:Uncharacterized protein n=1 Tax=Gordonia pseudamarae TaxID=2831662 RepID=A0ABX6IEF5_9ACTN|nr:MULTISPECIES: hypothetical protein [Gordonia]MBD0024005.1 hypothetical protein [Gordonia sp. (in: high G+C Gram-positive bacteria)]QHN24770.1 hypothetical protein GII33_01065 [Gordonia pseudamarae]QHN33703.1 hypothetical protein GII31_01065 [Gordonia pseudamarae]
MSAQNSTTGHQAPSTLSHPSVCYLGDPALGSTIQADGATTDTPFTRADTTTAAPTTADPTAARFLRLITLVQDGDATTPRDETKAEVLDELEAIIEVQQETLARLECLYETLRAL